MKCQKCDANLGSVFYVKQGLPVCTDCVGEPDETTEELSILDLVITCDECPIALDADLISYSLLCLGAEGSERCELTKEKLVNANA